MVPPPATELGRAVIDAVIVEDEAGFSEPPRSKVAPGMTTDRHQNDNGTPFGVPLRCS